MGFHSIVELADYVAATQTDNIPAQILPDDLKKFYPPKDHEGIDFLVGLLGSDSMACILALAELGDGSRIFHSMRGYAPETLQKIDYIGLYAKTRDLIP